MRRPYEPSKTKTTKSNSKLRSNIWSKIYILVTLLTFYSKVRLRSRIIDHGTIVLLPIDDEVRCCAIPAGRLAHGLVSQQRIKDTTLPAPFSHKIANDLKDFLMLLLISIEDSEQGVAADGACSRSSEPVKGICSSSLRFSAITIRHILVEVWLASRQLYTCEE